jgi:hypothetical protein
LLERHETVVPSSSSQIPNRYPLVRRFARDSGATRCRAVNAGN